MKHGACSFTAATALAIAGCGDPPTEVEKAKIEELIHVGRDLLVFTDALLPQADPLFDAEGNILSSNSVLAEQLRRSLDIFVTHFENDQVRITHGENLIAAGEAQGNRTESESDDRLVVDAELLDTPSYPMHEGAHYISGPHKNGVTEKMFDLFNSSTAGSREITQTIIDIRDFPYFVSDVMDMSINFYEDAMVPGQLEYYARLDDAGKQALLEGELMKSRKGWLDTHRQLLEISEESADNGINRYRSLNTLGISPDELSHALDATNFYEVRKEMYREYYRELTGEDYESPEGRSRSSRR